jgi:hypothetical protein
MEAQAPQQVVGEHVVRFGEEQALQLLACLLAVAVTFESQGQEEAVVQVRVAQKSAALGAKFVLRLEVMAATLAASGKRRFWGNVHVVTRSHSVSSVGRSWYEAQ